MWISWAMANRDPSVFHDPNDVILDRKGNRHFSFGIGVHRCIGSNVARVVFKDMLTSVLDRMPDFTVRPRAAPCTTTPSASSRACATCPPPSPPASRSAPGLDETLEKLQRICDEQELARPITERKDAAVID